MATNTKKILLLPGDGIGPEVVGETKKVIDWFNKKKCLLEWLDDIALSLERLENIKSFEEKMNQSKPWI